MKNKLAAGIFSFDRSQYLKQVLDSLAKNVDINDVDFFLFQDGQINKFSRRVCCKERDIERCVEQWNKTKLPNKELILRKDNLGIAINQYLAKEYLFFEKDYECAIFFEDDSILSRNYIRLVKVLLNQYKEEKHVGIVTCSGIRRAFSKSEKEENIRRLITGRPHKWGWGIWKDRWAVMRKHFKEYYKFVEYVDYKDRPHKAIKEFYKKEMVNVSVSSQDVGIDYALYKSNMFIVVTLVNRSKYIGRVGVHMKPEKYKRQGWDKIELDELRGDYLLDKFEEINVERFVNINKRAFKIPTLTDRIRSIIKKIKRLTNKAEYK